ncbi:MAG: hypothetical protein P8Z76_02515 [Alphaproteobacteria bacterium]
MSAVTAPAAARLYPLHLLDSVTASGAIAEEKTMNPTGFKAVSLGLASIALASTAIGGTAQAQSGGYGYHRQQERPRVNQDQGVLCRMRRRRVCTLIDGRHYCKFVYERVCRQVNGR